MFHRREACGYIGIYMQQHNLCSSPGSLCFVLKALIALLHLRFPAIHTLTAPWAGASPSVPERPRASRVPGPRPHRGPAVPEVLRVDVDEVPGLAASRSALRAPMRSPIPMGDGVDGVLFSRGSLERDGRVPRLDRKMDRPRSQKVPGGKKLSWLGSAGSGPFKTLRITLLMPLPNNNSAAP